MKGRIVPSYPVARVQAAQELFAAHGDAMLAAAATLPRTLRLGDGRKLVVARSMSGGLAYRCADGLAVIASYDVTPHGLLLHVSMSYANRLPSWAELTLIRAAFYPPDLDVIQVLPRGGEYVNVHPYCLHLFAAPEAWQGGWNV